MLAMNRENLTIINDGGKEEKCQHGLLDRLGLTISFSRCNARALLLVDHKWQEIPQHIFLTEADIQREKRALNGGMNQFGHSL
jgi:predicted AAA+ superfamily ATPase